MKDAGAIIDFNKVKSKVFNDSTQSSKGGAMIGKKYMVLDQFGKTINAEGNLLSKLNKRDQDQISPISLNETFGSPPLTTISTAGFW